MGYAGLALPTPIPTGPLRDLISGPRRDKNPTNRWQLAVTVAILVFSLGAGNCAGLHHERA